MELFKLLGKIAIDTADMERAFKKAREDGSQTEKKLNGAFSKMGGAAVAFGKTVLTGVAAGATAVGGIVTKSVQAYADFEQLIGGTELLFGNASNYIVEKSKSAYKDVQMSQNEYLQQVNGFAVGLKTAMKGNEQAAAELAAKIITAEADVVAATGNSQEAVQNAFNGIMKSNFSMLDNLQLGITPTKEGFQEVIDKVNEWNKANGNATKYQIDNLADCQSALVDYISMQGLAGYAANEAAETISGSIAMTKSAWQNLVSGLAQDNADIPALVSNVVSSGAKVLENIIPVAKNVLKSLPEAISAISPEAGAAFQTIIDVGASAFDILKGAIEPTFELISNVYNYIQEHEWVLTAAATAIGIIATTMGLYNAASAIKTAMAAAEVASVWGLVAAYAGQAAAMAAAVAPYLLITAAIAAVIAIGVLLYKNWDTIKEKAVELAGNLKAKFEEIKTAISEKFTAAKEKVSEIFNAVKETISSAWETVKNVVQVGLMFIVELIKAAFALITLPFRFIWENCKETILSAWDAIKTAVSNALNAIKATIQSVWNTISSVLSPIVNGIKDGISNAWNTVKDKTSSAFNSAKEKASTAFSALKDTVVEHASSVAAKAKDKFDSMKNSISLAISNAKSIATEAFSSMKTSISTHVSSALSTVTSKFNAIKDKISSVMETAKSTVTNAVQKLKDAFDFDWSLPKIKLPHVTISGKFSLDPPSAPKFSIEWYKKAMNNAMILSDPTIFGYANGKMLGAGEAGNEVVAGESHLMNLIGQVVETKTAGQNDKVIEILIAILHAITGGNEEMIRAILEDKKFCVGEREFGRLVRTYAR